MSKEFYNQNRYSTSLKLLHRLEKTMTDKELFVKYLPILKEDEYEPFPIKAVGCTLFTESGKSPTSNFRVEITRNSVKAIEYAFYWDYDIQHLYDLEHAFVYLDKENTVCDVISSFHGRFYRQSSLSFEGVRPVLYIQPGKHALMAHPEYFRLFPDFEEACNVKAGIDGVAVPDFIQNVKFTDADNERIKAGIKERFSFTPSGSYRYAQDPSEYIMPADKLLEFISQSVNRELG